MEAIQVGRLPKHAAPGWHEPIEMLDACHGHIHLRLKMIRRLADYVPRFGADTRAREAARDILGYFSVAAINHHEDEERDLFPALLAAVPRSQRRATTALIDRLLAEHRRMAVVREPVLATLLAVAEGRAAGFDRGDIEALASLYVDHMRVESTEILPLARRVLPAATIRSLGVTMSVRRGVRLEDLPTFATAGRRSAAVLT